jgi:hypothetical protein
MIIQQLLFGGAFSTSYPCRSEEIQISQRQRSRAQRTPRNINTNDVNNHTRVRQREFRDRELLGKDRHRAERPPGCLLLLVRPGGNLRPCHPAPSSARLSIPSFILCERSPARMDRLREPGTDRDLQESR